MSRLPFVFFLLLLFAPLSLQQEPTLPTTSMTMTMTMTETTPSTTTTTTPCPPSTTEETSESTETTETTEATSETTETGTTEETTGTTETDATTTEFDKMVCIVAPWTSWCVCSSTCRGFRSRTRLLAGDEEVCSQPELEQFKPCNVFCRHDCNVSTWMAWTKCSATCGEGMRSRRRQVETPALFNGTQCPRLVQNEPCNIMEECPKDCKVGLWGAWSACPHGYKSMHNRTRKVDERGNQMGRPCPDTEETRICCS